MKKNTLLIVIAILVLALSACASAPEATPASAPEVSEVAVEPSPEPEVAEPEPAAAEEEAAPAEEPAAEMVSFANDVMPIFEASCTTCHGDQRKGGLSVATYAELMAGNVITAGDGQGSRLIQLIESGKMPARGDKLTAEQVQIISDWVNQGAEDN